jgi:hypothetical protein
MLEKTPCNAVSTLFRLDTRTTAIRPATSAYSIAVTPWLSLRKRVVNFFIFALGLAVFIRITLHVMTAQSVPYPMILSVTGSGLSHRYTLFIAAGFKAGK